MKKFLKWTGAVLGGLIGLSVLAGFVFYAGGMKKIERSYPDIPVETIRIPADEQAVARGRHIATIWACTRCHGEDLSGKMITNDPLSGMVPLLGTISAPNLTSGRGGIAASYTDVDWVRAIRHGVMPEGSGEILMFDYSTMSDQDLGDLIAYLKQIPPVDTDYPETSDGPVLPIVNAVGLLPLAAERIDHRAARPAAAEPGPTVEYGKYLSAICTSCHGSGIRSVVKNWTQESFTRTFDTGVLPDGRQIGPTMSSETFRELTDLELEALWLYFTSGRP